MAGCLRRVSSELDDGDKEQEDGEMAARMEGQQRLRWWRRRWRGDGVGEANMATPAADPAPEESDGRDDGGDEFAATAAWTTMVGVTPRNSRIEFQAECALKSPSRTSRGTQTTMLTFRSTSYKHHKSLT
uniref:Uncharacterized protein n=1 Tax=Oryza meridionalis TaxID=40149 RepID=A0A0E0CAR3_9ORYZ